MKLIKTESAATREQIVHSFQEQILYAASATYFLVKSQIFCLFAFWCVWCPSEWMDWRRKTTVNTTTASYCVSRGLDWGHDGGSRDWGMRQRQHVGTDLLGELFERLKLFLVHQLEFGDEVVKVLVACVDVRLRTCNKDVILSLYFWW